jgi:peptidoglycan glycosyltransferase
MNRSILRLFSVVVLMFALLIVWASRWTVFSASALDHNRLNQLGFYASLKVRRGEILADNGAVLARSVKAANGTWRSVYPQGSLFAQAVGYYNPQENQIAGIEETRNRALTGLQSRQASLFGSFNGTPQVGDSVYTTLDPKGQALARKLLAGRVGAVVAIVPQTGAVKVMYSNPTYNDNNLAAPCPANVAHVGCQFNLATQGGLPPGSTFKLVVTAAALNSGKLTPNSTFAGPSPLLVDGIPLHNDGNVSYPPGTTLTTALTDSIDTIYAQVGLRVGAPTLEEYMKRFGFYSVPPMDYPAAQMRPSGEFYNGSFVPITNPNMDVGRSSIGQGDLEVTPLQMAMVVAAIANNGKLMEPRLTSRVVNSDGETVETIKPQEYDQVMRPQIAQEETQMMRHVVESGTGTLANIPGLNLVGKTGSASLGACVTGVRVNNVCPGGETYDDAWFVSFSQSDPKIAVAVELSDIPGGYGGTYAAPIAAEMIKTLLAEGQ